MASGAASPHTFQLANAPASFLLPTQSLVGANSPFTQLTTSVTSANSANSNGSATDLFTTYNQPQSSVTAAAVAALNSNRTNSPFEQMGSFQFSTNAATTPLTVANQQQAPNAAATANYFTLPNSHNQHHNSHHQAAHHHLANFN
jgi:hypothetical protein